MSDQFQIGEIVTIVIPAPAAGNNFNYAVPAGVRLRIHAISFNFATDANVIDRQIAIYVMDPVGGNSFNAVCQATQAANLNVDYCFADGNRDMAAAIGGFVSTPLSRSLVLKPDDELNSAVQNIQVGDQFLEIYLLVERFLLP